MNAKPWLPFLLLAGCVDAPAESTSAQHIIGGQQGSMAELGVVVGLQQGAGNWFCTGVLVDKDWVLTAASCFDNTNTTQIRVDDADLNNNGGRTITISEIHKHPSFDPNGATWQHDIAALKLAESVTDRTPATIHRTAVAPGTSTLQAGFGVSNDNGNGGGVLRTLASPTVDCAGAGDTGITNANLLCFDANDGNGSCYGDGGAPAFVGGGRAVGGIGSGGTDNSCTDGHDIYTAIAAELTFIDMYVPQGTTPPPTDPTDPPPVDPEDPDGPGRGTDDPTDGSGSKPVARGCNTGGGTGWLVALALGGLLLRRRAKTA